MHKLYLYKVGPIDECEINIDDFLVLTGAQASGKSTIAKSIFFFRTIKDDILDVIMKKSFSISKVTLTKAVTRQLRNKFLQIFGTSRAMSNELKMRYEYDSDTFVSISLRLNEGWDYISPNYVYFEYSRNLKNFFNKYIYAEINTIDEKNIVSQELNNLFSDYTETIFIPAGRSLITLLTTQLNYIFTSMNEDQKRSIDFCTQKYIELILKIRTAFSDGINGYLESKMTTTLDKFDIEKSRESIELIDQILKGRYVYVSGEERLNLDTGRFVKINYTSSGQQESVWIFNILMYQLINNTNTFLIVEEPEAHLYPDAQKKISELMAVFKAAGNSVLLTTHSPYILGALNNLLYASFIKNQKNACLIEDIVPTNKLLNQCNAYFVNDGEIKHCFDSDCNLISNDVIDGASYEINAIFDKLIEIESGDTV